MNRKQATSAAKEPTPREVEDQMIESVRASLQEILDTDPGLRQADVAQQAGLSPATISLFVKGEYTGNSGNIARKLKIWIDSLQARRALKAATPDVPQFFASRTAEEIMTALRLAQALDDIVMVVGAPGLGKTTSCIQYRRDQPNVWIATLAPQRSALMPVLKEISSAVGGQAHHSNDALSREIIRRIKGRQGLLIVDEAHHATTKALDAIRSIHDDTGTGIALLGGPELTAKVESMPQLRSRVGLSIARVTVTAEDITALMEAWNITDPAAKRELSLIAKRPGALRSVTKVLRLAANIARGTNEPAGLEHIRQAARTLSSQTEVFNA